MPTPSATTVSVLTFMPIAEFHHQRVTELGDQHQRQHDAGGRQRIAEAEQAHQEHRRIQQIEHRCSTARTVSLIAAITPTLPVARRRLT
jgi:hypothetical protein